MKRSGTVWLAKSLKDFPTDGLDYDLVFTFPLPYVTSDGFLPAVGQQAFERQLQGRQHKVADLLGQAYEHALGGNQDEVLRSVIHKFKPDSQGGHDGAQRKPDADAGLEAPLLQGGNNPTNLSNETLERCDPDYSLGRAQECTILLFIATLEAIDSFCQEELKKGGNSDPGTQVTVHRFPGTCGRKFYVCCGLSTSAAELLAEIDEYPVQLSFDNLAANLGLDIKDADHAPAHVPYSQEHRDMFHLTKAQTVLRPIDFIRILHDKIGDLVDLSLLKHHGLLCDDYPSHSREALWQLQKRFHLCYLILWPSHWSCIQRIRNNFGEEIALYFCFLRELSLALAGLSVFAVLTIMWTHTLCSSVSEEDTCPRTAPTCVFSAIVMVWFRAFTLRWYQIESHSCVKWGVSAHSSSRLKESPNARLQCGFIEDPVDSRRRIRKAPAWQQFLGITCSTVLTGMFVTVLLLLVAAEHFAYHKLCKRAWDNPNVPHYLTMALGVMTGIQIKVVDGLWNILSNWIIDFEYRWTEQGFLESKRFKSAIVKFITGNCTMLYLAIIAATVENTSEFDLYQERLATQLKSLFFTRYIVLGSFNRLLKPYLSVRFKYWWRSAAKHQMTFTEVQALMEEYTDAELSSDFMDVLVPLSLVLYFSLAAPGVVLLMLVLVVKQFNADIWKLVHTYQRPFPRVVNRSDMFDDFLEFGGVSMIFMNLAMISVIATRETSWHKIYAEEELSTPHFLAAMVGLLLWYFLAWLVPPKAGRTLVEERRHSLERHLLRRRQKVPFSAKLDVAVACPTACPDFAGLMCPRASRATQKLVQEGLRLG